MSQTSPAASTIKPSSEQEAILSAIEKGESIVGIARAGAAKTTTARWALALKSKQLKAGRKILVLAFNAQVEADMQASIRSHQLKNIDVFTFHRLARKRVGHLYANNRFQNRWPSGKDISVALNINQAVYPWGSPISVGYAVLETIHNFCLSSDREITAKHIPLPDGAAIDIEGFKSIENYARKAWYRMGPRGDMPVTHDAYLKYFTLNCPDLSQEYDMLVLEEGQDINPVIIGMVDNFSHGMQIAVFGDPLQQIYDWRKAEDSLSYFANKPDFREMRLTTSYRFGENIAQATKDMLRSQMGLDIVLNGANSGDKIMSFHPALQRTIVTRTNTEILWELHRCAEAGIPAKPFKDMTETLNLINAADQLRQGTVPEDGPLSKFKKWDDLEVHAASKTGQELQGLLTLYRRFNGFAIPRKIIEKASEVPDDMSVRARIGTAHGLKGGEFPFVELSDGFINRHTQEKRWTPEETRILYVAMTRAKKGLNLDRLASFFQDNTQKETPKTSHTSTSPKH